jgi:hypothetical protein
MIHAAFPFSVSEPYWWAWLMNQSFQAMKSEWTWTSNGKKVQWDTAHQSSNPGARTFSWIFQNLPVCDVPTTLVTSRISRSAGAQSFGGAHRGRLCVHVFIGWVCVHVAGAQSFGGAHRGRVCVRVFIGWVRVHVVSVCVVLCNSKTKHDSPSSSIQWRYSLDLFLGITNFIPRRTVLPSVW